jgi:hypothetical protein
MVRESGEKREEANTVPKHASPNRTRMMLRYLCHKCGRMICSPTT